MSRGYDVYLDKCLLPVPPAEINISINNENETITLINEGEINILKKAGLTDIEFEFLIPQVRYPFAVYTDGFKEASYYMNYLEALKTGKKPFQFIVTRQFPNGKPSFNTNMKVSLEDYKITEDAENGFDLRAKVNLKQYRDYGAKTVSITFADSKAAVKASRPAGNAPQAGNYTVKKGDCLSIIARRYYNSGSKWPFIYEANRNTIGGNPNLIYPGQVLTIPSL